MHKTNTKVLAHCFFIYWSIFVQNFIEKLLIKYQLKWYSKGSSNTKSNYEEKSNNHDIFTQNHYSYHKQAGTWSGYWASATSIQINKMIIIIFLICLKNQKLSLNHK